jgi:hypothetical protein
MEINLSSNLLEGFVPVSLGNLTNLRILDLSRQEWLSGPIPTGLGNLTALETLKLGGNALTGPIPPQLGNLSRLKVLDLGNNQGPGVGEFGLSGAIPAALCNLTALQTLFLDGNRLEGTIPACLGSLPALTRLFLDENALVGNLPGELGNLAGLIALDVSQNPLEGELSRDLMNLGALQSFSYQETQLCAPGDAAFQAWLDGIAARGSLQTSGLTCGGPPVAVVVPPNSQATLNSSADQTSYTFPAGTLPGGATVTHTPLQGSDTARRVAVVGASGLIGIGHQYEVEARDSMGQLVQPARPYTVTIGYSANQAAAIMPATLALYFWDGAGWQREPTSRVDTARRVVSAAPSHFSRWAVLGDRRKTYLPLTLR